MYGHIFIVVVNEDSIRSGWHIKCVFLDR